MPLPDLIEIISLDKPVRAEITVPGSKSITNRALILAALADGEAALEGALWSEDTQVMTEALVKLGFEIKLENDAKEFCNRRITIKGLGGKIPNAGTPEKPLELFVGNAGTAARFLAALVCLGNGVYRLHGVPRMHERPQAALFKALRGLGYRVDSPNDKLPAVIYGAGLERGSPEPQRSCNTGNAAAGTAALRPQRSCTVSIEESSQFASALLLCARVGGWKIEVAGENAEESPYVAMTTKLIEVFPSRGGTFQIEPDASSGSYFLAAGHAELLEKSEFHSKDGLHHELKFTSELTVRIVNWPLSGWQVDQKFFECFSEMESRTRQASRWLGLRETDIDEIVAESLDGDVNVLISRRDGLGDSIMTAIVTAPLLIEPTRFTDLGRLRFQECERVIALRTELTKCGAKVIEEGDTLTVYPSKLHGAEIETYNDHRMAMCFAILGLKVPGIKIRNPACVKKTFPNFFQKLATPPPSGLGATILDARTGRKLGVDELFAD